jgi:hypothetical protein
MLLLAGAIEYLRGLAIPMNHPVKKEAEGGFGGRVCQAKTPHDKGVKLADFKKFFRKNQSVPKLTV